MAAITSCSFKQECLLSHKDTSCLTNRAVLRNMVVQSLFIYVTHIGSTHRYLFSNMSKYYCLCIREEVGWGVYCLLKHLPFVWWSLYLLLHTTPLSLSCVVKKKEVVHQCHFHKERSWMYDLAMIYMMFGDNLAMLCLIASLIGSLSIDQWCQKSLWACVMVGAFVFYRWHACNCICTHWEKHNLF